MLGGHRELAPCGAGALVFLLHQGDLRHHLPCIAKERLPLRRRGYAPARTHKDRDVHLLLQRVDGVGETWLGDEELPCRLGDVSGVRGHDDVAQLVQCHENASLQSDALTVAGAGSACNAGWRDRKEKVSYSCITIIIYIKLNRRERREV